VKIQVEVSCHNSTHCHIPEDINLNNLICLVLDRVQGVCFALHNVTFAQSVYFVSTSCMLELWVWVTRMHRFLDSEWPSFWTWLWLFPGAVSHRICSGCFHT